MIVDWLFAHPEFLGYLMVWCVVLTAVSVNGAIDAFDAWMEARRARSAEADEIPATDLLSEYARRRLTSFLRHNVTVSTFGDRRRRTPAISDPPRDTSGLMLDEAVS